MDGSKITAVEKRKPGPPLKGEDAVDAFGMSLAPALWDLHVHLREPGQTHKETIATGAKAAAAGGLGHIFAMPNTEPAIDSVKTLRWAQIKAKKENARLNIEFIAAVTKNRLGQELTDIESLCRAGAAAFSDDGSQIKTAALLKEALKKADKYNKPVIDHCDDPSEAEAVQRDIRVLSKNPGRLHIAHISTAEAVQAVRKAKKSGLAGRLTCEAAPHHFTLTQEALKKHKAIAKVNPPLASQRDVEAILEGLADGTIDAIASDHAPHSKSEKSKSFDNAPPGMTGMEIMLSLTLSQLVRKKVLPMMRALKLLTTGPAAVMGRSAPKIAVGESADLILFDSRALWTYDKTFSKSKNTPFWKTKMEGKIKAVIHHGKPL